MTHKIISSKSLSANRFEIVFSDLTKQIFHDETIIKYRLFVNSEIDDDILSNAIKDEDFYLFLIKARNYTISSMKSEYQVRTYLKGKEADLNQIEKIIIDLRKLKLIDDMKYATYKTEYLYKKGYGRFYISGYLSNQMIEDTAINASLDKISDNDFIKSANELIFKQRKNYSKYKKEEQTLKLMKYLEQRGFPYSIIKKLDY